MHPKSVLLETDPRKEKWVERGHEKLKIPSLSEPILSHYMRTMQDILENIFATELDPSKVLTGTLPLLKWEIDSNTPGILALYLLANDHQSKSLSLYLRERSVHTLVDTDQLRILSSRNFSFSLFDESFYFEELLIEIPNENVRGAIEKSVPLLIQELKISRAHGTQPKSWFASFEDHQHAKIHQTIVQLMRRYPTVFDESIFRMAQYFLLHYSVQFSELRPTRHLERIICTHYLFYKALLQEIKLYPGKRHLYCKLLKTRLKHSSGQKTTLGIVIVVNSLQEYESFTPRHIVKAIQRWVPNVRAIADSFYQERDEENKLLKLYLEVEKNSLYDFSLSEIYLLKRHLNEELRNSIEYLSPALFLPRNEEELLRNIILLSNELKYVNDLPQAIISFQGQHSDVLTFNVILLRLLSKKSGSLQTSELLSPTDRLVIEKATHMGFLRKRYAKEATVFSIEIDNQPFLRKNHSVDLLRARQYIVKTIEKLVGPFRDYNGGFLHKQRTQLDLICSALADAGKQNEVVLENFFYSLSPPIMQTVVTPELGKSFFMLFLSLLNHEIPKRDGYVIAEEQGTDFYTCVIKAEKAKIKEHLFETLTTLDISPQKLASTSSEIEGHEYCCFLYLNPTLNEQKEFSMALKQALLNWSKRKEAHHILRLHLPLAPQSLDPRVKADRNAGIVIKMLYEGLMRVGKSGKTEPAIAEKYLISNQGTTYRFYLKESYWSNGTLLSAYDFEAAWEKILDPNFSCPYAFLFFSIKNAKKAKEGSCPLSEVGIAVINERELLVDLEHPFPPFLDLLAHWIFTPLCHHIQEHHPGWAYQSAETHIGNGPFKLLDWKLNDDLTLVKNPLYWDAEHVQLEKISIHIIEDEELAHNMFLAGNLDWHGDPISKLPLKAAHVLAAQNKLYSSPISGLYWLELNSHALAFKTATLRRAFSAAISRKALSNKLFPSFDQVAYGFIHDHDNPSFIDGDPEAAQALFEQGLKELHLTREDLPPILISHSEYEEHGILSREIGKQWHECFGLKIAFQRLNWHKFFSAIQRQDYMVAGLTWYSCYRDPSYYLNILNLRPKFPGRWENSEFYELMQQAENCFDPQKRLELIIDAEKRATQEMPVIPLLRQCVRYSKSPLLHNVILSENGMIDFREAYFEEEPEKSL